MLVTRGVQALRSVLRRTVCIVADEVQRARMAVPRAEAVVTTAREAEHHRCTMCEVLNIDAGSVRRWREAGPYLRVLWHADRHLMGQLLCQIHWHDVLRAYLEGRDRVQWQWGETP